MSGLINLVVLIYFLFVLFGFVGGLAVFFGGEFPRFYTYSRGEWGFRLLVTGLGLLVMGYYLVVAL